MAYGSILGQTAPIPTANDISVQQSTAQKFGLSGISNVDAVFQAAATMIENNSKITTLSYIGTGSYGENYPNSITCNFPIKIIYWIAYGTEDSVSSPFSNNSSRAVIPCDFLTTSYKQHFGLGVYNDQYSRLYAKKSEDGKTVSWYFVQTVATSQASGFNQANELNTNYFLIIFG